MDINRLAEFAFAGKMIPNAPVNAHRTIEIDGPIDRLWSTLTTIARWEEWYPYLKNARLDGPFEAGAGLTYGGAIKHNLHIAVVKKGELVMIYGTMMGYTGITRWDIERLAETRSRVTFTESSDGFLIGSFYSDESLGTHLLTWLEKLKAEVESDKICLSSAESSRQCALLPASRRKDSTMPSSPVVQEIVVVTGASSGIGAASARELARRGFHVLAGVRRDQDADALRAAGIEPLILDITNPEHIQALATRVHEDVQCRALRAVVNNAGIGVNAPVETFALNEWRRLFEVNFFGHLAIIQTLLPSLIGSKGRVVNISSVGGKVAMPTYGPYAGTKFALEAVSDALRREVEPLGVKVIVFEPGAVQTEMLGGVAATGERIIAGMNSSQRGRYTMLMHAVISQAQAAEPKGVSAERAGRVIANAITSKRPHTRYTVGLEAAILVRLVRLLSDRMLDRLFAAALRPHLPKNG